VPLVTLYLTDRCNSRCVTCDYWRHGREDLALDSVRSMLPDFAQMGTQMVVLSGGEPLLNREWLQIARLLRAQGLKLWLLTSGLALAKFADPVARLFDAVTVSLDGANAATYAAIRGLDAFDKVCEGIRAVGAQGLRPGIRVTLQRGNYRQLPEFVELAMNLGAGTVSFLAVDVANPHAFGRIAALRRDLALSAEDLPEFERILSRMETAHGDAFRTGFIAESPAKLRRILQYFAALLGQDDYPKVRCNAPELSAVIGATGRVQPCFFIEGPADAQMQLNSSDMNFSAAVNSTGMRSLRAAIRTGQRQECRTCVCSLWRDAGNPISVAHA
jgi:Fe-coproporphyrin III synthase